MNYKKLNIIFLLIIFYSFSIGQSRQNVIAAISSMKGDAKIKAKGERKFTSAYKGQMIKTGEWLKTGDNVFLTILFLDGSVVKIQSKTELEIKSSRLTANELKTQMYISEGQAWSKISNQNNGEFKVKTPTAVATVKGTEFDVEFDDLLESTKLTVIEGEVLFGNEISEVLASAMEGATANKNQAPTEYTLKSKDIPKWQNNVEPSFGFRLKPTKQGRHPINNPMKIQIQAISLNSKKNLTKINDEILITSDNNKLLISNDKSSWSNNVKIVLKSGRSNMYVKGLDASRPSMVVSSENAESTKLSFEFFVSKNQRKAIDTKISNIFNKKGFSDLSNLTKDKLLFSTSISNNQNLEELLKGLDIGEFNIIKSEPIKSSDGTLKIKLIIEPRGLNK